MSEDLVFFCSWCMVLPVCGPLWKNLGPSVSGALTLVACLAVHVQICTLQIWILLVVDDSIQSLACRGALCPCKKRNPQHPYRTGLSWVWLIWHTVFWLQGTILPVMHGRILPSILPTLVSPIVFVIVIPLVLFSFCIDSRAWVPVWWWFRRVRTLEGLFGASRIEEETG